MPRIRKRDVVWIALVLALAAAGAALATATSRADGDSRAATAALPVAAATDPSLTSGEPSVSAEAAGLATAAGVAGSTAAPQAWRVGGSSVVGYAADDGRFCFEFRGLSGGCLRAGTLSDRQPLDVTVDRSPEALRVYGLALDGVLSVAVRIDGGERPAALAHNAFAFATTGGTAAAAGELVATMADGTTRTQAFPIPPLGAP